MSIREAIKAHESTGLLARHTPLRVRAVEPELRELYLLVTPFSGGFADEIPTVYQQLNATNLSPHESDRWIAAEQYLDDFVAAPRIPIPPSSRHAGEAFMSRLEPEADEVWDIRCYLPPKGLRIFGRFAEKDLFVALSWDYRETLESDIEYGKAKLRSMAAWEALFPGKLPLNNKEYPYGYITGASWSTDHIR